MKVTVKKIDDANVVVSGTLDAKAIEQNIDKLAIQAGKDLKVDGFRQGKVPAHVVKKLHGEKLEQDAEGEAVRELIDEGLKEAKIKPEDMIGQPAFKKYEKTDKGIEVEVEISKRPEIDLKGYMDVVPKYTKPKAAKKDLDAKMKEFAEQQAPYEKIARKRAVKDGDMTVIDFEGFIADVAFEGGSAEKFNLKIGSGSFIPGFEEQIIGMKYEEEKEVTVTFPKEYGSEDLAGKEATFKVKLHEIQEQKAADLDDAFAQKVLSDEKATLDTLKKKLEDQITSESLSKLYNDELKPQMVEALVKKFDFALPNNIVDQEVDAKVNAKAQEMDEKELETYKTDSKKLDKLRDSVRDEARDSVKATFIVDALAKEEKIEVDDQEVMSALYYQAMMSGQNAEELVKYYQENNLMPAAKMGLMEDKLFGKMLGFDK
ncbi:MAG: trigger factor [Sulfurovum sp.]|nr:trigger factor [Sulfurovum sp.]